MSGRLKPPQRVPISISSPDHLDWVVAAFAAHLTDHSGRTPYDVEYKLQRKDGSYRWFRATGETMRDTRGVPLRVVGGPENADDLRWWEVRTPEGNVGWAAEVVGSARVLVKQ